LNIKWFGLVGLWCLTPLSTYIMAVSFIGREKWSTRRKQPTCCKSLTNFITQCCIEYTSPWARFELKTLLVIGTDYTGSCKTNYHTITTTTDVMLIVVF